MPTAIDTLREELNKLNAAIAATRRQTADLAKQLLRDCTAIGERVRSAPESIEALMLDIREVLTERMLAEALARQATAHQQRPDDDRPCPGCQQPLAYADTSPRIVQTRAGEAEWSEPEAYCSRCRRAFFPSVPEPGDRPV